MYLLLPLLAAIAFALGSMVFKRAYAEGAGIAHALVVNNVLVGLIFLPLLAVEPRPVPWHHWHQPVLTAAIFTLGHLLNVLSLRMGDVSVATPLLGAKVIFIGLLGWGWFGARLEPAQWWAAALATAGVVVMGLTDLHAGGRTGRTTVTALACAATFALTDLMIQTWGGDFGAFNFLALQFAALGIFSVALLPFFGPRALVVPRRAWKWVFLAAAFSAAQGLLITVAIAVWRDAARVNVIYATRGLWSIALVWGVGHWLKNTERHTAGRRTMAWRLVGAGLLLAAVVLTVKARSE